MNRDGRTIGSDLFASEDELFLEPHDLIWIAADPAEDDVFRAAALFGKVLEEWKREGCASGVAEEYYGFKGREGWGNAPWSADKSAVGAAVELCGLVEAQGETGVGFDVEGYCPVEGLLVAWVVGNGERVRFDKSDAGDRKIDVLASFPAETHARDGDFGEIARHRLEVGRVTEGFTSEILEYAPCESTELVKGDKGYGHPDVVLRICWNVEVQQPEKDAGSSKML